MLVSRESRTRWTLFLCAKYLLPSLQESAYDPDVAVFGGCVNRSGPSLIRHVQVHSLLEQHRRAFRVSVQRSYVHQRRSVLRPFEYARFEFVGEQLDDGSVPVLRRQMHGRAILMIRDGGRRSHAVKILDEGLVAFRARYVQRCLPVALQMVTTFHSYSFLSRREKRPLLVRFACPPLPRNPPISAPCRCLFFWPRDGAPNRRSRWSRVADRAPVGPTIPCTLIGSQLPPPTATVSFLSAIHAQFASNFFSVVVVFSGKRRLKGIGDGIDFQPMEGEREKETNSISINNRVCMYSERELSRNRRNLARLRDGGGRNIRKLVMCGKERKKEREL